MTSTCLWLVQILCLICVSGLPQFENKDETKYLLSDAVNNFNQKLYSKLAETKNGNFLYSPFSLHMVMSQVYHGAPLDTNTSKELSQLLSYDPKFNNDYLQSYLETIDSQQTMSKTPGMSLNIANKMYMAKDLKIKDQFKNCISKYYHSNTDNINFAKNEEAVAVINSFAKNNTNGLIDQLLQDTDVDAMTRLVLINAIYFKGKWKTAFEETDTREGMFNVDSERQVPYSAMRLTANLAIALILEIKATAVELPYEGDQISMIVVLPDTDSNITQVGQKLDQIRFIADKLEQKYKSNVEVSLPKFEMEFEWESLKTDLESLGVKSVFKSDKSNLSEISDEPLYVSEIVHKAVLKVNEEGSEAVAISENTISPRSGNLPFIADRPFVFIIYDKKQRIPLFVGRLVDPNGKMDL